MPRSDPAFELVSRAFQGRYTLLGLHGRGGMGLVYRARDERLPREVALKVLRPDLARTLAAKRFTREIELAAKLANPHIVPVLEAGEAQGLLYLTMPFIDGPTLRAHLQARAPLPIDEAVRLAEGIAAALAAAHGAGIIHRDIKPENVLLAAGEPMVTDFGVARALTAAGGERLTTTGFVVGTTEYMSPEQAASDRALDGRADQYALGCVLYEMLTGSTPFGGGSPRQVIARHLSDPPPAVGLVRPGVPPEVAAAVARALAKAPEDRFPDALAFKAALREAPPAPAAAGRATVGGFAGLLRRLFG